MPLQQRLETDLEDVRLTSIQRLDAINIDVYPDYLMAEFRQAGGMGSTQIVRADDAYPQCHSQIFPRLATSFAPLASETRTFTVHPYQLQRT